MYVYFSFNLNIAEIHFSVIAKISMPGETLSVCLGGRPRTKLH